MKFRLAYSTRSGTTIAIAAILGCMAMGLSNECNAATVDSQIYWSDVKSGIVRANVDGSNAMSLTPGIADKPGFDCKIAVDSRSGSVFWSNHLGIHRTDANGTTVDLVGFSQEAFALGMALDPLHDHLYFVEARSSTIHRIDLDGANPRVIVPSDGQSTNFARIDDLRIDPMGGKLYWSHTLQKSFERSSLDGSERELLFTFPDYIHDFDIDLQNKKIYWSKWGYNRNSGAVLRANFDGSQQETLISQDLWGVYGLALDVAANKLYLADYWTHGPTDYDGTIRSANLDGTMVRTIVNFGPSYHARAIALGMATIPEPSTNILILCGLLICRSARLDRRSNSI